MSEIYEDLLFSFGPIVILTAAGKKNLNDVPNTHR
jgi:hypothetical protein